MSSPHGGQCAEEFTGDVALEAAADVAVAQALVPALLDVGVGACAVPPAGQHDGVQCPVQLPVTAAVEAVPVGASLLAGSGLAPASAANAASSRHRPTCENDTMAW